MTVPHMLDALPSSSSSPLHQATPHCFHTSLSPVPGANQSPSSSGRSRSQPFFCSWRLFHVGSFPGWPLPSWQRLFPTSCGSFSQDHAASARAEAPQNIQLRCRSPSPEVTGYIYTHSLKPRASEVDISALTKPPEIRGGSAASLSGHQSLQEIASGGSGHKPDMGLSHTGPEEGDG